MARRQKQQPLAPPPREKASPQASSSQPGSRKSQKSPSQDAQRRASSAPQPRVALVCDWLTTPGGAEKVLFELHHMYPEAPIYTSQYSKKGINWFNDAEVHTGWLQIFPRGLRKFLGILRQFYFSHLDLSDYDLVISVTGAEAKSVRTQPKNSHKKAATQTLSSNYSTHSNKSQYKKAYHLCYCHIPTQYYWEMYDQYLKNPGFGWLNPLVKFCFRLFVRPLRQADYRASQRVDQFVTISHYSAAQIKKYYHRDAEIVAPPVAIERFSTPIPTPISASSSTTSSATFSTPFSTGFSTKTSTKSTALSTANPQVSTEIPENSTEYEDLSTSFPQVFHRKGKKSLPNYEYYVISCRQVTWKRVDLAIEACLAAGRHLVVIGDGAEHERLRKLAQESDLIVFIPWLEAGKLAAFLQHAKAYLFPSMEPFGIAPVEALAAGCPVIAYAKGGSLDFVQPRVNGVLFQRQSVKALETAIHEFERQRFNRKKVAATAQKFASSRFREEIQTLVNQALETRAVANTSNAGHASAAGANVNIIGARDAKTGTASNAGVEDANVDQTGAASAGGRHA